MGVDEAFPEVVETEEEVVERTLGLASGAIEEAEYGQWLHRSGTARASQVF
ncbi:MAG: hypothetical protein ACKV19_10070 [Verrucomicrobiales bacterium]